MHVSSFSTNQKGLGSCYRAVCSPYGAIGTPYSGIHCQGFGVSLSIQDSSSRNASPKAPRDGQRSMKCSFHAIGPKITTLHHVIRGPQPFLCQLKRFFFFFLLGAPPNYPKLPENCLKGARANCLKLLEKGQFVTHKDWAFAHLNVIFQN